VLIRLAVAGFLIVGPATDEPAELAGWDAERFQEIADREEGAWAGQPVEYPPGSVVVLDRVAGDDVVATHRRLVALSLVVDLGTALALWRRIGPGTGRAFLLLGLPLVPLGYQRLDTLVTALAVVAALALLAPGAAPPDRSTGRAGSTGPPLGAARRRQAADALAASAIAVGALTKVWPLVLVVGAVAIGRWRAAVGGLVTTALLGGLWLVMVGDGLEPIDQVVSLRGATGWHVESLPGTLVALVGDTPTRLELNAYRIGTLAPGLVTAGRVVAVTVMGLLAFAGRSAGARRSGPLPVCGVGPATRAADDTRRVLGLTVLGAVATLLVTAPLLSPQFLVWTTPFAALLVDPDGGVAPPDRPAVGLAAAAAVLTGLTLTAVGPADLAGTVPASLLTIRNLCLATLPLAAVAALVRPSGTTRGTPAGERGHRPTPGRSGSAGR
jgi:hypothetical protein